MADWSIWYGIARWILKKMHPSDAPSLPYSLGTFHSGCPELEPPRQQSLPLFPKVPLSRLPFLPDCMILQSSWLFSIQGINYSEYTVSGDYVHKINLLTRSCNPVFQMEANWPQFSCLLSFWGLGGKWDRTQGFMHVRQTLYQLSYIPSPHVFWEST